MSSNLDHVLLMEYRVQYSPELYEDMVALFNQNVIDPDEVHRIIDAEVFDSRVVTMSLTQWKTVFKNEV